MAEGFSHYVVKRHPPIRRWMLASVIAGLVSALLWFAFDFGRQRAGFDAEEAGRRIEMLELRLAQVKREAAELRDKATTLERSTVIDQQAYAGVETNLKALQDENYTLKQQLSMYQSIVAAGPGDSPIRVQRLKLQPVAEPGSYHYRLTLIQGGRRGKPIKGTVTLTVEGTEGGKLKTIPLKALTGGATASIGFSFKYYQNLEGELVLPREFEPRRVRVRVVAQGKKTEEAEVDFAWSEVIA